MSDRKISHTTKALIKTREILSDINNWCPEGEGYYGVSPDGRKCVMRTYWAISRTLMNLSEDALKITLTEEQMANENNGIEIIVNKSIEMGYHSPVRVNEAGHEKVLELLDKSIYSSIMADQKV